MKKDIEWINNKVLLYRTGTCIKYPVANHHEKACEKECIDMYTTESPCYILETDTTEV